MANCKKCGAPLTKGNIKFVRKPGKRPYRVCRVCRYPEKVEITKKGDKRRTVVVPPPGKDGKPDLSVLEDFAQVPNTPGNTAGDVVQRPQEGTGGPLPSEAVYFYSPPPRYRFFMTRDQANRVLERLTKNILFAGFGIGFEVIPVPEDQVEANPESFAEMVEVNVEWPTD
jgi:hypothetical protein